MLNFLVAMLLGSAAGLGLQLGLQVSPIWAALVTLAVFGLTYWLLTRRTMKAISDLVTQAQKDVQAGHTEKAVRLLESGYRLGKWQFFAKPQINSQIGMILYMKREFKRAFPYLLKCFNRHWVAMAMLAVSYMRRHNLSMMEKIFEKAVAANRKEAFLWSLYAYCLNRVGKRDEAIKVLERALKKIPASESLQNNLDALKNNRKMKMHVYGDLWYQFHLEKPGTMEKRATKAMQGRRKMPRR